MEKQRSSSDAAIIAIGIFKLAKCLSLLALGAALVHWRDKDFGALASKWISRLWISHFYFDSVIARLSFVSRDTVDQLAIGAFVYAALLLVEGVGLCLRKRWAEYLTIGITSSLLPLEFYEIYRELTLLRVVIALINILIVVYLVARLVRRRHEDQRGVLRRR
jgi:uncharacterized membrane protein (DUF2068 family)